MNRTVDAETVINSGSAGVESLSRRRWARVLSIVGHPGWMVPVCAGWAVHQQGGGAGQVLRLVGALLGMIVAVTIYTWWHVKSGKWSHVDAVRKEDRRQLNVFLLGLHLVVGLVFWNWPGYRPVGVALLHCGAIILVALMASRWLKISLHMAFGVYAVLWLWPGWVCVVGLLLMVGVGWSRLVLKRHTLAEVVTGTILGVVLSLV